jgi:hypothetical protein
MNLTSLPTGQLVDRFGALKASAAEITADLDAIKTALIDREGECKVEGELFRLSLSHTITSRTDWKAVALALAKKAQISDKAFDALVAGATDCGTQWIARSSARVTK